MRGPLAALLALGCIAAGALPARAAPPVAGLWTIENGSAIFSIAPCGGGVCGRLAGYEANHPADPPPLDWLGRPQCGETLLTAAPDPDGLAYEGRITDPRDGKSYRVRLAVDANGGLALRGYVFVPLFGQTQHWTRVRRAPPADCRILGVNGRLPPQP